MATTSSPYGQSDRVLINRQTQSGDITSALTTVVSTLRAYNFMLGLVLEDGEAPVESIRTGISEILEQQADVLAGITNEVFLWQEERSSAERLKAKERNGVADAVRKVRDAFIVASAEAGTETQVIAEALNMRRSSIERVISQLRGTAPIAPGAARSASA